jgi:hypothetical protein
MSTATSIPLSRSEGGVNNTTLKNWKPTFKHLSQQISNPTVGEKDGAYFVRGPVDSTKKRTNANITEGNLIVLDGDSRIENGEILDGAPPPQDVHEVLCELEIPHILYTSYSHGTKGNRYRVLIFPSRPLQNATELKDCIDWLIHKLHAAGVHLHSVSENYRWAQPWYFPRKAKKNSPFLSLSLCDGNLLSVERCQVWAVKNTAVDLKTAIKATKTLSNSTVAEGHSPIGRFNTEHGHGEKMLRYLVEHGYELIGQTRMNKEPAYRLLAPGSKSRTAGVLLFKSANSVWRVCSHHSKGNDPLAATDTDGNLLAHDAFGIFTIFEHAGNVDSAVLAIAPKVEEIKVTGGSLAQNVREVIQLIEKVNPATIFQRGPMLVRIAHFPQSVEVEGCKLPEGSAVILPLSQTDFSVHLCGIAIWKRAKTVRSETTWVNIDPPANVAKGVLAAQGHWSAIPFLKSISETPIIRRDGSIYSTQGYDPSTNMYYEGSCPPISIPPDPTLEQAREAAKKLLSVFSEFPFVDVKTAKSVVLAYIFTLILRGQLTLAPLFAVSATTPGSGKGLLIEVCNLIVRGRDAAIMPPVSGQGAEEETRKRITALLLQGATSVNLDNWVTPIGGESLNGLLTANEWSDRVLGRSDVVKLPNRVTWGATGNNLTVRGDMVRRTVLVQIDPMQERPESRKFKIRNLNHYVLMHRAELLSAAFTVLQAYCLAGRPEDDGLTLGRFEDWSRSVCAPIRWLGLPDPTVSQERLRQDDPETTKLERLLSAWYAAVVDKPVSVAELVARSEITPSNNRKKSQDLKEALLEFAGEKGFINTRSLGWQLKHFSGRVVAKLRLQRSDVSRAKAPKYFVTAAD